MSLNIKLYFTSGKEQLLEKVNYTDKLVEQLKDRIRRGVIKDFEVY